MSIGMKLKIYVPILSVVMRITNKGLPQRSVLSSLMINFYLCGLEEIGWDHIKIIQHAMM